MSKKAPPEVVLNSNRPPKGHRQRGAGTVIVSKPPVLTEDGILLKPFERLPTTMLQELCQREKRLAPKYNQCKKSTTHDSLEESKVEEGPRWRFEVLLEDKKTDKLDLRFTPNQSFTSEKVAKDFSALLALWHFQNKLPEPYKTTWLGMLAADKDKDKEGKRRGKAVAPGAETCVELKSDASADVKQGGADEKGAVVSVSRPLSAPSVSIAAPTVSLAPATVPVATKTPPAAVLDLRSTNKHASSSVVEQEELMRRIQGVRTQSQLLAFAEANKPPVLVIPDALLSKIRVQLGLEEEAGSTATPRTGPQIEISRAVDPRNPFRGVGVSDDLFALLPASVCETGSVLDVLGYMRAQVHTDQVTCPVYSMEALDTELETMQAIYPHSFSFERNGDAFVLTVASEALFETQGVKALCAMELCVVFGEDGEQSHLIPWIRLLQPSSHPDMLRALLLCQVQLWTRLSSLHVPVLYDLLLFAEETLLPLTREVSNLSYQAIVCVITDQPDPIAADDDTKEGDFTGTDAESSATSGSKPRRRVTPVRNLSFWDVSTSRRPTFADLGNKSLPAYKSKAEFLELIRAFASIVVTGETGSGKTTQIPQFILEQDRDCKIVVCQPRRLAAVSVAVRVADELKSKVGEVVGYMVRGEAKVSKSTQIVFCTYGVMLRRMQDDPSIDGIDYVILDEVHERGMDSDFAFAMLLQAVNRRRTARPLKLIIMSATILTEKFSKYIGNAVLGGMAAPVLAVSGHTFPVVDYYKQNFEAVVRASFSNLTRARGQDSDSYDVSSTNYAYRIGGKERKGDTDYDLLIRLLLCLVYGVEQESDSDAILQPAEGAILVFMKGVPEITRTISLLEECIPQIRSASKRTVVILPLHSNLSAMEQRRVFGTCGRGEVKVVVSTNIAEASVTIPDVTVVVDTCRVKELAYDAERQMTSLESKLAAQDALRQRRGRAGRVTHGRCFKLITEKTFTNLPAHSVPEMLRIPLDRMVLQTMSMGLGEDFTETLAHCIDPPHPDALESAYSNLVKLQAINDAARCLSVLGKHMSALPCAPKVARLLIYGVLFGTVSPATVAAAIISSKSPYLHSNDAEVKNTIERSKKRIMDTQLGGFPSDHLVLIKAVAEYESSRNKRKYCVENGLSADAMSEIVDLRNDLLDSLSSIGLIPSTRLGLELSSALNKYSSEVSMVCAVLCSGVYPQVARVTRPPKRFLEVSGGSMLKEVEANELKYYIPLRPDEDVDLADVEGQVGGRRMQRVQLNKLSVYTSVPLQTANYVIYSERHLVVQNLSHIAYVNEISPVTPLAVLLFFGSVETDVEDDQAVIVIDGWIRITAADSTCKLILAWKNKLDESIQTRLERVDASTAPLPGLSLVAEMLASELKSVTAGFMTPSL